MKVDRMSISFEADLGAQVREAAKREGKSLSAWLAEAASAHVCADTGAAARRTEALKALLAEWERENGALTEEELRRADEELGFAEKSPSA